MSKASRTAHTLLTPPLTHTHTHTPTPTCMHPSARVPGLLQEQPSAIAVAVRANPNPDPNPNPMQPAPEPEPRSPKHRSAQGGGVESGP